MCQQGATRSGKAPDNLIAACRNTGVAERVTQKEQGEEHSFLDAVMQTRPMQYVHSYLAQKVACSAWCCSMHLYSSLACLLSMHTRSGLP